MPNTVRRPDDDRRRWEAQRRRQREEAERRERIHISRDRQQRTTQNAKLDSLLSGIRFSPDDPDADALAALNAQTEPETALALLEGLLARQQAAQETVAAALKDTEAKLDEVQRQLGAAQQARQLAAQLAAKQESLPLPCLCWKLPVPRAPATQAMPPSSRGRNSASVGQPSSMRRCCKNILVR